MHFTSTLHAIIYVAAYTLSTLILLWATIDRLVYGNLIVASLSGLLCLFHMVYACLALQGYRTRGYDIAYTKSKRRLRQTLVTLVPKDGEKEFAHQEISLEVRRSDGRFGRCWFSVFVAGETEVVYDENGRVAMRAVDSFSLSPDRFWVEKGLSFEVDLDSYVDSEALGGVLGSFIAPFVAKDRPQYASIAELDKLRMYLVNARPEPASA